MKVTECISRFLNLHTHKDLAALYHSGMEVQVMIRPDGGYPNEGGKSYTDGFNTWFNFRIPKNARTEPEFQEWELRFPLQEHCLAIGMTGWNFAERKSMHLAYDFDAICGTSHLGTGISQDELGRVREAACAIPWVEVRKSTGGSGLHLRVHLGEGVPTSNHTEHAALGRAVLAKMSAEAGFDFADKVDICGGNMWVYHRKMAADNGGLSLVKPREHDLTEIPDNWRDHVEVVSRRRRKVRVPGLPDSAQDKLAALSDATKAAQLDDQHRRLIDWLTENGWTCVWEPDHGMLRTHTAGLAEAHGALQLLGYFKTLATGRDKSDYNCFCFPRPEGGWRVVRYGAGTLEADTWIQDGGWTYCYFNQRPDLRTLSLSKGGVADEDGGFVFPSLAVAAEVAAMLDGKLDVSERLKDRQTKLRAAKDDSGLVVEVKKMPGDENGGTTGWIDKRSSLRKVIGALLPKYEGEQASFDSKIRRLFVPGDKERGGWVVHVNNDWRPAPKDDVVSVLMNDGMSAADAKATCGQIFEDGWTLTGIPFEPEYLSGRRWNRDGAQFRFTPADDPGEHPHWDKILDHCGHSLTEYILQNEWCRNAGITTGGLYLRYWLASMFRYSYEPLPYLFFYSEPYQNCGKSSFHEAANLLMTRGVMRADQALQSAGNFNGELHGAILCVVEETDLSKAGSKAYDKMKDWVTGREINIHKKGWTPFMARNTAHFVQCSNLQRACPMFPGDTRVTMIHVDEFEPGAEIPWPRLKEQLEAEAPAFLRTLLDTYIPPSNSRLRIPVIDTAEKRVAISESDPKLSTGEALIRKALRTLADELVTAEFFLTLEELTEAVAESGGGQLPSNPGAAGRLLRKLVGYMPGYRLIKTGRTGHRAEVLYGILPSDSDDWLTAYNSLPTDLGGGWRTGCCASG